MPEERVSPLQDQDGTLVVTVRSLRELIDAATGRTIDSNLPREESSGLAESLPFPFLAFVGQMEMKLALLLCVINPLVGGVLLLGPRGTGKTTLARSLVDLLPKVERSLCFYGCLPEDVAAGGLDAVCPDCARKFGEGDLLTRPDSVRLVELPLNALLDDVIGGVDDRAAEHERMRLRRGILAQADMNLLYADEVNLLQDDVVNAILDAAAAGAYTVRRGAVAVAYRSRFSLIGSMNPEEGRLRPQILDRFGLRVIVRGLDNPNERYEAYLRSRAYRLNPRGLVNQLMQETLLAREEIQAARKSCPAVEIPPEVAHTGSALVQSLGIDSLRAEMTLFEAARAYAAADSRRVVGTADLRAVAPMALRLRRSTYMLQYFKETAVEDAELTREIDTHLPATEENHA